MALRNRRLFIAKFYCMREDENLGSSDRAWLFYVCEGVPDAVRRLEGELIIFLGLNLKGFSLFCLLKISKFVVKYKQKRKD